MSIVLDSRLPAPAAAMVRSVTFNERQFNRLMPELAVLVVAMVVCAALFNANGSFAVDVIVPATILLTSATANYLMVREDRTMLLSPLFAVRVLAMVVVGAGSLFNVFAPASAREMYDYMYVTSVEEAAKVNLVCLGGLIVLFVGIAAAFRIMPSTVANSTDRDRELTLSLGSPSAAIIISLVGFTIVALSSIGGAVGSFISIPAVLATFFFALEFSGLYLVGVQFDRSVGMKLFAAFAFVSNLLMALVLLNKSAVLYPTLMFGLGFLTTRITLRRVILCTTLIVSIFVLINPLVQYGRTRQSMEYGSLSGGSIGARLGYMVDYTNGDRLANVDDSWAMSRFDFVMPASFVISQYDNGVPSDELATSGYMFVPRFIWHDKPLTSTSGLQVNHLMGIQSDNQIGVTVFADLYWNFGWLGLLALFPFGLYVGVTTVITRGIVAREDWIMLPFVFATFKVALSIDNDFASALMVPAVITLALYIFLRIFRSMLPTKSKASRRPPVFVVSQPSAIVSRPVAPVVELPTFSATA